MNLELKCVGVDGAKSGWIAVWRSNDALRYCVYDSASLLIGAHSEAKVMGVDVPIGLPESGSREADVQARRFVGGRRACSIFSSPVRGILDSATQPEASKRHRAIDGRGFGAQSFAILPKIREWDLLLVASPHLREIVREIHPEVSFAALNGGFAMGLIHKKRSAQGRALRLALLTPLFGEDQVDGLLLSVPRKTAAPDDVLDALVGLWSAERIASGTAASLPSPPERDAYGLTSAIWY